MKLADDLLGVSLYRIAEHDKPQQSQGPGTGLYVCLRHMHQICIGYDSHGKCHEAKAVTTVGAHHLHAQKTRFSAAGIGAGERCNTNYCCVPGDSTMNELSTFTLYVSNVAKHCGSSEVLTDCTADSVLVGKMLDSLDAATYNRDSSTCPACATPSWDEL